MAGSSQPGEVGTEGRGIARGFGGTVGVPGEIVKECREEVPIGAGVEACTVAREEAFDTWEAIEEASRGSSFTCTSLIREGEAGTSESEVMQACFGICPYLELQRLPYRMDFKNC